MGFLAILLYFRGFWGGSGFRWRMGLEVVGGMDAYTAVLDAQALACMFVHAFGVKVYKRQHSLACSCAHLV